MVLLENTVKTIAAVIAGITNPATKQPGNVQNAYLDGKKSFVMKVSLLLSLGVPT